MEFVSERTIKLQLNPCCLILTVIYDFMPIEQPLAFKETSLSHFL